MRAVRSLCYYRYTIAFFSFFNFILFVFCFNHSLSTDHIFTPISFLFLVFELSFFPLYFCVHFLIFIYFRSLLNISFSFILLLSYFQNYPFTQFLVCASQISRKASGVLLHIALAPSFSTPSTVTKAVRFLAEIMV